MGEKKGQLSSLLAPAGSVVKLEFLSYQFYIIVLIKVVGETWEQC